MCYVAGGTKLHARCGSGTHEGHVLAQAAAVEAGVELHAGRRGHAAGRRAFRRQRRDGLPELRPAAEGEPFDAGRVEGLAPILDAALRGEESSEALSERMPSGRLLMAVPLEGEDGDVDGALVGTFRMPNLAGALLVSVGVGAVLLLLPAGLLGLVFGFVTAWGITRRIGRLAGAARAWRPGDL